MLNDFKNILKKPILLLSMLAIATIPAIYTTIFLGSMWDPYDSKDQLIIDVVNEDEGSEMDGEEINLGEDLRSEEHTSELQSRFDLVCRLLLEKNKKR